MDNAPEYVPAAHGVTRTLPDGVDVPARAKLERGRYVPQRDLPERGIKITDRLNVGKRAEIF
eukprot:7507677-Pyramimonas_sp.AAC.1